MTTKKDFAAGKTSTISELEPRPTWALAGIRVGYIDKFVMSLMKEYMETNGNINGMLSA